MTCHRIQTDLDALLDGELDAAAARALEQHARACADCGRALAGARALGVALRGLPVPEPRPEFLADVLRRARDRAATPRGGRRTHVLAGLGGALAAGLVAVAMTVLWQRPPDDGVGLSVVTMAVSESRTVNLVFAAAMPLDDVALTVELPPGIEVQGQAGRREVRFSTRLAAGNNVLPLRLVATGGGGGELVARLRHGDEQKTFVVTIEVS